MTLQQSPSFSLRCRMKTRLRLKLALTAFLILWISPWYYLLQYYVFFPITQMTPSRLDLMIGFAPETVWIYLSLYLLMPIGPLITVNVRHLCRYALGMVAMSLFSSIIFLLWPTACQRPPTGQTGALYQLLVTIDRPLNSFPSLHTAFAVFSALCWEAFVGPALESRLWRAGIWAWTLAILYSTISTRQHVALDIAGGSVLAVVSYLFAFRTTKVLPGRTFMQARTSTQT